jgi:hypothetical protein
MPDLRKKREGLYRISYPHALESDVRTREIGGTEELTIAERFYTARGYKPAFADLPWYADYLAQKRLEAKRAGLPEAEII